MSLSDRELQSLRNWGNLGEEAADEIERWQVELNEAIAALPQAVRNERERCATICDEAKQIMECGAALADADDRPAMLSTAWRIGLCAAAIRKGE